MEEGVVKYIDIEETKFLLEKKKLFRLYVKGYDDSPSKFIFSGESIRYLITEIRIQKIEYFLKYQDIPEDVINWIILNIVIKKEKIGDTIINLFNHQILNEEHLDLLLKYKFTYSIPFIKYQEISKYLQDKYNLAKSIPPNYFKTYYKIDKEASLSLLSGFEKGDGGVYGYYFYYTQGNKYPRLKRCVKIYPLRVARRSHLKNLDKIFIKYEDIIYVSLGKSKSPSINCEDKYSIVEPNPNLYRKNESL